ncbi:MAG: UDP-N-acetylmuramoylalanyl-D-glutamyl-2,6-diaminopimelate--D-alanyl-D-alanine ligase [Nitratireductor sp.]|nr:UDP-N-acetylmuramoylalanyl-D-glutamyl-2,6-diaminopimelate--D-alanyl-D-alanine ligase [Nitratireductor sp.]MCC0022326.1 UDP-N-acetylmuramoylalanyl-D-glutamyl-2,6-diaminopimelate--D-alanyl-D-alanine ligase [Nitratireductor sp.]
MMEQDWLWDSDAFISATNGRPVGDLPEGITGISIDTRTLQPGEAYFAIKGERMDGHDFVSAAMKAGAGLAVVAEEKLVALGGIKLPLVVVRDVLGAMRRLGEAARARSRAQIIAVTGSVGKTTTKEMMRTVLSASGKVHASAASFNNHWGVPLTLARMPDDTRFGIFEIGMNHPDEIRPLVKMVRPHVAMINNVAAAHLGAFKSIDEIAHAKCEIFEGVVPGGYGLINRDDERYSLQKKLAEQAGIEHLLSFGEKRGADFKLKSLEETAQGSRFVAVINRKEFDVTVNAPGRHLVQNALAVLGVASLCGADMEKSVEAFKQIVPEKGRGRRHRLKARDGGFLLIDESYNANTASMAAALRVAGMAEKGAKGRRIAVLGDMRELGSNSERLHRSLAGPISENGIDLVYTVGEEIAVLGAELGPGVHAGHYADRDAVMPVLAKSLRAGDVIMLKASNGLGFAKLVDMLRENFPEVEDALGTQTGRKGKAGN